MFRSRDEILLAMYSVQLGGGEGGGGRFSTAWRAEEAFERTAKGHVGEEAPVISSVWVVKLGWMVNGISQYQVAFKRYFWAVQAQPRWCESWDR